MNTAKRRWGAQSFRSGHGDRFSQSPLSDAYPQTNRETGRRGAQSFSVRTRRPLLPVPALGRLSPKRTGRKGDGEPRVFGAGHGDRFPQSPLSVAYPQTNRETGRRG